MKSWMKHAVLTACILAAAILPRAFVIGSNSNGFVAGVFAIAFTMVMPVLNLAVGAVSGTDVRRMWLFPLMLPVLSALCWQAVFWEFSPFTLDFVFFVGSIAVGYAVMAAGWAILRRRRRQRTMR
jgi:hypothetical protein